MRALRVGRSASSAFNTIERRLLLGLDIFKPGDGVLKILGEVFSDFTAQLMTDKKQA